MLLTQQQLDQVHHALSRIQSKDRHSIEDGLSAVRSLGNDAKPYLAYLMRSGSPQSSSIILLLDTFRDDWAAKLLYEILENHSEQKTAERTWYSLRSMGKLPKEWRQPQFNTQLWEKCRTKPAEMPARTEDDWRLVVKWNLLFKLMEDDPALRNEAADEISYIGRAATPGLLAALEEDDLDLWKVALVMLKRVGDTRALVRLQALVEHEDSTVSTLANSAIPEVSTRVPEEKHKVDLSQLHAFSAEGQAARENYAQQIASPSISGKFDPQLERRVIRALLRTGAPDADEKKAGWQEFDRMGAETLPILKHYAEHGNEFQKPQAKSVIRVLFPG